MLNKQEKINLMNSVKYWWHWIDFGDGVVTPGKQGYKNFTSDFVKRVQMPSDLKGKTVLDIGCSDGLFSFEAKRRGAKRVVAVDHSKVNPSKGFFVARKILGLDVEFIDSDIYNLDVDKLGKFDLVLGLGLLYHLPSPYIALRIIKELTKSELIIQSRICGKDEKRPIMVFIPNLDRLKGVGHSMWHPSASAVELLMQEVGFKTEVIAVEEQGMIIKGYV